MTFREIDYDTARAFIERWHYSGLIPKGSHILFGWFDDEGELYAVADFGNNCNPYQASYLSRKTGKIVTDRNLVDLKRLARRDPKIEGVELTTFLKLCHKALRTDPYRKKYVVSFSDPAQDHNGGVYKAASYEPLGETNAEWHLMDENGETVHRRTAYRYAQRNGCTTQEAREALRLRRVKTPPKARWFKKISNRA